MRAVLLNNVPRHTGIGRYTLSLYSALKRLGLLSVDLVDLSLEIDLNFPGVRKLEIAIHLGKSLFRSPKGYDIYHLPNQFIGMASLWTRPSVISIHDAFSLTSGFVMNSLYGRGLSFALSSSMVICPSEFSRQQTIHTIGLDSSKTSVIFPGIDHSVFHKRDKEKCRQRLGLSQDSKIVLNVSTTLKYKNIPTLLEMFKIISEREPRALLIRVGYPNPSTPELNALANDKLRAKWDHLLPLFEKIPCLDIFIHDSEHGNSNNSNMYYELESAWKFMSADGIIICDDWWQTRGVIDFAYKTACTWDHIARFAFLRKSTNEGNHN